MLKLAVFVAWSALLALTACAEEGTASPDCQEPLPDDCHAGRCEGSPAQKLAELCVAGLGSAMSALNECGGRSVETGTSFTPTVFHFDSEDQLIGIWSWTDHSRKGECSSMTQGRSCRFLEPLADQEHCPDAGNP